MSGAAIGGMSGGAARPAGIVLPGAGDAEVRELTVLFCDFVGSSALSARMDAEDFGDLMRQFHETVHAAVSPFGGFVAQLLGDGQLVLFGYPDAHDDSPAQAVRAALAILAAIPSLGPDVAVRIGVHTGPCSVRTIGAGGRQDTLVVGETANVAARVQSVADVGTAFITATTERLVAGWFDVEPRGEFELKGFDTPLTLSSVVAPSRARTRFEARAARGLLPMVGRGAEHDALRRRWSDVLDGHGQVVVVEGEAGIGKSRLVRALRDDLVLSPHTWLHGSCSIMRQNTAFHPIVEMVESALGIQPEHDVAERRARLGTGLGALGLASDEPLGLLSALLQLDHPAEAALVHLGPEGRRQKTIDGLAAWLLRLSARQPVVLEIEDHHWSDPSTRELLAGLVAMVTHARVLVLVTARTGQAPSWTGSHATEHVLLEAISPSTAADLVHAIVRRRPTGVDTHRVTEAIADIVDRAGGNPLFIEEITRALLDDVTAGSATATGTGSLIPQSLNGLVAARLDALGPAKAVAQAAAVIGRDVTTTMVCHLLADGPVVSDEVERAVRTGLVALAESGLVLPGSARSHDGSPSYRFKHALVHEATYQSMLRSTRTQLHGRMVRVWRDLFAPQVAAEPEVFAVHAELGGLPGDAIRLHRAASQQAAARSAWNEAIGHADRASAVLADHPDADDSGRAEVELRQSIAVIKIRALGYAHPDTVAAWEVALVTAESAGDHAGRRAALLGLGTATYVAGRLDDARERITASLALEGADSGSANAVACHTVLGNIAFIQGRYHDSLAHVERAMSLYRPERHHRELTSILADDSGVTAWAMSGWALHWLGRTAEALERAEHAVALARSLGDACSIAQASGWRLVLLSDRDEPEAVDAAHDLIRFTDEQHLPAYGGLARVMLGRALGQTDLIVTGATMGNTTGTMVMAPAVFRSFGDAHRQAGQLDAALEMLDLGLDIAASTDQHYNDVALLTAKAELALAREPGSDPSDATLIEVERLTRDALEVAVTQSATFHALAPATILAGVLHRSDRTAEAVAILTGHLDRYPGEPDLTPARDASVLLDRLRTEGARA